MPEENNPEQVSPPKTIMDAPQTPKGDAVTAQKKNTLKSLRTYQGDVDEIISSNKISVATVAIAEQQRRDRDGFGFADRRKSGAKNRNVFLVAGGLLLFGIIIVSAVYYIRSSDQIAIEQKTKALINFSQEKDLLLTNSTREELVSNISKEKQSFKSPVNSVLYINTVNADGLTTNIGDVLQLLAPRIPASLVRAFDEKYMLGVYSFDTNESFIILTINDFAEGYAGMLKWENGMIADIGGLFGISQNTPAVFEDETLQNKDLRIVKNANRNTVLLYSFIDKNTLVITANQNIFKAIVGKYLINKMVR